MRTRLGAVAGAITLLIGGALATAPATAATARAPWCGNADLAASYRYSDAGAGHVWGWIVLRNRSTRACRTGGFVGLAYVGGGDGTRIGAPADRTGSPATYLVRPGGRVRSLVQETRAENYPASRCRPRHVDGFRVYVPDATRAQFVPHPTVGCLNATVHLLTERPLRLT
jgi:hypothetical protein